MPLPAVIEIEPLQAAPRARVVVPGSKSITNRALVLAALTDGVVRVEGALWSDDTQVMCEALRALGFSVEVEQDAAEPANRCITVEGRGGAIPAGGTVEAPLELFVGNAGTAARFLTALVALGRGAYRLAGVPRMAERPQAPLIDAMRGLGFRVDTANGRLPAVVHGGEPRSRRVAVSARESSQFASALLLAGRAGGWEVEVTDADPEEIPYIDMTRRMVETFPHGGGTFQVEPDASSGSYFWAASWLLSDRGASWRSGASVQVDAWPHSGWQVDARFPDYLPFSSPTANSQQPTAPSNSQQPTAISRDRDLGDSIMTAIVLAPLADAPVVFTDLGRLRVQECERVVALRTELTKCGARVEEEGDTLTVWPGELHGAEIETYDDHRMAMCFGVLGLVVPGMRIRNPACVAKTFPNFWRKLAEPGPGGFGAVIRDGESGEVIAPQLLDAG